MNFKSRDSISSRATPKPPAEVFRRDDWIIARRIRDRPMKTLHSTRENWTHLFGAECDYQVHRCRIHEDGDHVIDMDAAANAPATNRHVITFGALRRTSSEPRESSEHRWEHVKAMTCGEAVMTLLSAYEVDTVFGMAGTMTVELYRGIALSGIRHVQCRNEQGASLMADGYARATGKPGVCTIIAGPGVTNAATGIAQAYCDSQPLLVLSGACPTPHARERLGSDP